MPLLTQSNTETEISLKLWSKTLLGETTNIIPLNNENTFLVSNKKGIVTAVDIKTQEILLRKFFANKNLKISANGNSILVYNQDDLLENIFNIRTGQLLLSNPHLAKVVKNEKLAVKTESIRVLLPFS